MRALAFLLLLATAASMPKAALAQAPAPASPGCAFNVKVLDARRVWLNCGREWPDGRWTFTLWEYDEDWEHDPSRRIRSGGVPEIAVEGRVAKLTFRADALHPSKEYRLLVANEEASEVDPVTVAFSTVPEATLSLLANRTEARLESVVALDPNAGCVSTADAARVGPACELVETLTPKLFLRDGRKSIAREVKHSVSVTVATIEDIAAIGSAALQLSESTLSDGAARISFSGLSNVFGETVVATGDVDNIVPASADDAELAVKVGFQAAQGERAAYTLDGSVRPTIAAWGLTYWRLLGTIDIGHNDSQSANAITVGTELGFPFRQTGTGWIFGVKPIASVNYETDKHGDVGNLLGSIDAAVRLKGLYRPRKVVQSVIAVELTEQLRQAVSASKVKAPDWGLVVPLKIGVDFGGTVRTTAAEETSVPSSDSGKATIARLRLGSGMVVEFQRLTVSESFIVRYLFTDERQDRNDASAPPLEGFKASNDLTFKVSLDRLGHYALALTYKYGAAPPLYKTVESLVSSIAILF